MKMREKASHFCDPAAAFCSFTEHDGTDGTTAAVVFTMQDRTNDSLPVRVWHNDKWLADWIGHLRVTTATVPAATGVTGSTIVNEGCRRPPCRLVSTPTRLAPTEGCCPGLRAWSPACGWSPQCRCSPQSGRRNGRMPGARGHSPWLGAQGSRRRHA